MPEALVAAAVGIAISVLNRYGLPQLDAFWLAHCGPPQEAMDESRSSRSASSDEEGVAYTASVQGLVHPGCHGVHS